MEEPISEAPFQPGVLSAASARLALAAVCAEDLVLGCTPALLPAGEPVHGAHLPPFLPLVPYRTQAFVAFLPQPRH